jgi:hypothetical protein
MDSGNAGARQRKGWHQARGAEWGAEFFCGPTPVSLPKRADFERRNLQVIDYQMLPVRAI